MMADNSAYNLIITECLKLKDEDTPDPANIQKYLDQVSREIENSGSKYDNFKVTFNLKKKVFNDPIHGSIQLNPLEDAIVNTPEFYRLREIKQLGGKSHVFPGAVHTRFEHSIGVCHLAGLLIDHLDKRSEPEGLTAKDKLCVRLAGLCHDLGHGPYSHLFESVTKKIADKKFQVRKHEEISVMVFKRILLKNIEVLVMFEKCGLTGKHVKLVGDMIDCSSDIMNAEPKKCYLYEVVANKDSGMDVDKWDYFARDCHYLGLKNEFDMGRCLALSSIIEYNGEYHIGFRDKEKRNIYGMFRTRCVLYQKAYSHKTANGIDMMISDALCLAQDIPLQLPSTNVEGMSNESQSSHTTEESSSGASHSDQASQPTSLSLAQDIPLQRLSSNVEGVSSTTEESSSGASHNDQTSQPTSLCLAQDIPLQLPSTNVEGESSESQSSHTTTGASHGDQASPTTLCLSQTTSLKEIVKKAMENDLTGYIQLTDSILRTFMLIPPVAYTEKLKEVQDLIHRIAKRDIYKCIVERSYYSSEYLSPKNVDGLTKNAQFPSKDFEVESISIKYASEESEDPTDKMFFFDKKKSEDRIPCIQERGNISKSQLNIPRSFVEYRLRLYSKKENIEIEAKKKQFCDHVDAKMATVKKVRS